MKKKIWFWLFTGGLLLAVLFVSWSYFENKNASAAILSEMEAKKLVQERYQGTVTQITLSDNHYDIKLVKQNFIYNVKLDARNGDVMSLKKQAAVKAPASSQKPAEAPKELTEADARLIAENQVHGDSQSIRLETKNEVPYYLVEVKTNDGEEATVQIHTITGVVMSVTWDDHHQSSQSKDDTGKDDSGKDDSGKEKVDDD